jgi:hypothetical protein
LAAVRGLGLEGMPTELDDRVSGKVNLPQVVRGTVICTNALRQL